MKKLLSSILGFIVILSIPANTFAYTLSDSDNALVSRVTQKIEKINKPSQDKLLSQLKKAYDKLSDSRIKSLVGGVLMNFSIVKRPLVLESTPTVPVVVDPVVPAEYKSALNKANAYANKMHMSKRSVYDQLISEYGEKFSIAAAQYAIDNVKSDWNANALAKAKSYQNSMNMSPSSIHDQLTSEYGEKFIQAEADYAIQHLND